MEREVPLMTAAVIQDALNTRNTHAQKRTTIIKLMPPVYPPVSPCQELFLGIYSKIRKNTPRLPWSAEVFDRKKHLTFSLECREWSHG